jgi:hypothetical protein
MSVPIAGAAIVAPVGIFKSFAIIGDGTEQAESKERSARTAGHARQSRNNLLQQGSLCFASKARIECQKHLLGLVRPFSQFWRVLRLTPRF